MHFVPEVKKSIWSQIAQNKIQMTCHMEIFAKDEGITQKIAIKGDPMMDGGSKWQNKVKFWHEETIFR